MPIADIASATIMAIKSAGMTIGEIRGRSKPTHEKQDDDDDQDDANDTYATVTEAVAVPPKRPLKPPSRKMMRMITRISPNDMVLSPSNKTASKEYPAPCRDTGVHGAGPLDM